MAEISAATALYPNGPKTLLGNQDHDKVLGTFEGNHEGALLWGEPKHREAYVGKYGYEKAISVIEDALKSTPTDTKEAKGWATDMQQYRADLLGRQGS